MLRCIVATAHGVLHSQATARQIHSVTLSPLQWAPPRSAAHVRQRSSCLSAAAFAAAKADSTTSPRCSSLSCLVEQAMTKISFALIFGRPILAIGGVVWPPLLPQRRDAETPPKHQDRSSTKENEIDLGHRPFLLQHLSMASPQGHTHLSSWVSTSAINLCTMRPYTKLPGSATRGVSWKAGS